MSNSLTRNNQYLTIFSENWGWFLALGIALIILGAFAISVSELTTLISVMLLGFTVLAGGIVIIIDTFKFWWRKWSGFALHLIMGLLYLFVGFMLIKSPLSAAISLTLLLSILFIGVGIFRIIYAITNRMPGWGWNLFNGIITLLLGLLIIANWPASSLTIIGLFVGIDLFFCGWAYVMVALASRNVSPRTS